MGSLRSIAVIVFVLMGSYCEVTSPGVHDSGYRRGGRGLHLTLPARPQQTMVLISGAWTIGVITTPTISPWTFDLTPISRPRSQLTKSLTLTSTPSSDHGPQPCHPPQKNQTGRTIGNEGIKKIMVCEPDKKTIKCPIDTTITIESAFYGQPGPIPGICTNNYRSTCNKTENVIDHVFQRCEFKSSCLITPRKFDKDPCPNVTKHVMVKFKCISGIQKGKQTLDLSGKGFEHVPKILNYYVASKRIMARALDLSKNKISKIEEGAFGNLVHLETLILSGNPLQDIRRNMWEGLSSLRVLHITSINLTNVEPNGFAHLKSLKLFVLNLTVLKKFRFFNTSSYPNTPEGQVKFRIELGEMEITNDSSFCFLNNMKEKGLIEGFTESGKEIPDLIGRKDQNPFWNYLSVNCDNIGQNGKNLPTEVIYVTMVGIVVLLILLVVILYKCTRTGSYKNNLKEKHE